MNSTLGSVVPLAMFLFNFTSLPYLLFAQLRVINQLLLLLYNLLTGLPGKGRPQAVTEEGYKAHRMKYEVNVSWE